MFLCYYNYIQIILVIHKCKITISIFLSITCPRHLTFANCLLPASLHYELLSYAFKINILYYRERIERMKEEERLEREAIERRLRRDLITKTFPKTREDFDQLYAMVPTFTFLT